MRIIPFFILVVVIVFGAIQAAAKVHDSRALEADPLQAEQPIAPKLNGLGDYSLPITTSNPESQFFFDQGLKLTYAFNHSEALRAFKEAIRLDPGNAMAYWGWALVLGPNLNLPMMPDVAPQAYEAIQQAVSLKENISKKEQDFIEALASRYARKAPTDRRPLDLAYAEAMKALVAKYPQDLDAATLYAASLMNLSPWNYWNLDGTPKELTTEILTTLQSVIDRNERHAGALHYYIHTVEARHPDKGEKHADMLEGLMPGAGHLVHMPSHIYMRVGRFADSYRVNANAVQADEMYITQCRAQGIYPLNYYPHNIHFMAWSAMVLGRPAEAMDAARKIVDKVPHELSADKNVWSHYETFLSQPVFVMTRFGMWDEMLAEPQPDIESKYMLGVWHYGKALAYIHTDRVDKARSELDLLTGVRKIMSELEHYIGFSTAGKLLTIAEEIVLGEIAYAEGNLINGLAHLERALRMEDSLLYSEPPDWYFPVRHFLGAMLLDAGRPSEAEVIYAADLRKNPGNGYSLYGLKTALEQQGKDVDARAVSARYQRSWAEASHVLTSSRF